MLRECRCSRYGHCFEAERSLSDDPSFMAAMAEGQILDPSQLQYYLTSGEFNAEEGMENLRAALKEMGDSEGVKKIKLLTTKNPVPDCFEGISILVVELMSIGKENIELYFVEGEHNHFLHWEAPELFWESIS